MKKFVVALMMFACAYSYAIYKTVEYTPNTNGVITITGDRSDGIKPIVIMQEITGTQTNTVSSTYNPYHAVGNTSTEYRLASMSGVIGGSETPLVLTPGSNAPLIIMKGDTWTMTCTGTASTNISISMVYELP